VESDLFCSDTSPEGPVTVFPNDDRRLTCEEKKCKRHADLWVVLESQTSKKGGRYWCVAEHWIQARSLLISRKIEIRYAEGAIDRIMERFQAAK
jgi:hypothetical protein